MFSPSAMNPAFRRFLSLLLVFACAFLAVVALRTWRAGGSWRDWFSDGGRKSGGFRPEKFTLPEHAAVDSRAVNLLSRLDDEYAAITGAVVPSVVSIDTIGERATRAVDFWGRPRIRRTQGQGSGVIVTHEGHVITNHHVIAGQNQIRVTTHEGKSHPAKLIGEDSLLDIAVLKIQADAEFQPLKFGDSSEVRVGQMVFAVGNPFGLGETVTQGIISAKERSLSDNQRDLFQTDAAINPGNSGGPLINLRGEIIGINVAIFSPDRQNPGFQGVGFSIPGNEVKDALFQVLEHGRPIRGYLGVQMENLNPLLRQKLKYDGMDGALVSVVIPGSPAEKTGLRKNDIVISYNGIPINTYSQLIDLVHKGKIGDSAEMIIWRNGKTTSLRPVITERIKNQAQETGAAAPELAPSEDAESVVRRAGLAVRDLTVPEQVRLRGARGVVVTGVSSESPAAARVLEGDFIAGVNGRRVGNAQEFLLQAAASLTTGETKLNIFRDGGRVDVPLPILSEEARSE